MTDLDKGGNPFEFVNTYFGPTLGWVRAQLLPTVTPPSQPTVGPGGGGGGGSIVVGSTPVAGGVNGSFLYDNAGIVGEQTVVQVTAQLGVFTATLKGLAPASGGGTANFLRADGTWALPPGGTTSPGGSSGQIEFNNAGSFGGFTMSGDVSVNTGTGAATIANGAVSYGKMQNVSATSRFLGRISAGAGVVEELTGTQVTTLLDLFTPTLKGLAPLSGGGTVNFLRADGSWAAPSVGAASIVVGSTTVSGGTSGNYGYNNAGIYGEKTPIQLTADINVFTTALKGAAPASGGGTVNYLRADGTWNAPPGGGVTPAALSGVNDTNVTLTLTGTPLTALLQATTVTAGWTGTLAAGRLNANVVQSVVNDTNVTGAIAAQALTLGWTGTLGVARGGIGVGTITGLMQGTGTTAVTGIANSSTVGQALRVTGASTYAWGALDLSSANAVVNRLPFSGLAQGTARSVLGVTGNATADNASIQGTADQALVVNGAGTALAFGTIATGGITNLAVTYAKIQNVSATSRFLGRITVGSGVIEELTGTQATSLMDLFTTTLKGLVPGTASSTTNFLRADGTWAVPAGGGGGITIGTTTITSGTTGRPLYDNAGIVGELTTGNLLAVAAGAINANEASQADYRGATANRVLSPANVWAAMQPITITNSSSVTPDFATGFDFIWTIGQAGTTLNNPGNNQIGQKGMIYIIQDATGGRTITTWGTRWKFPGGVKPTLSTAAGAIDVMSYCCKSTNEIECFFSANMS